MSNPLRIIFAGTPIFAAYHLKKLIHSHHKIIAIFTQPQYSSSKNKISLHNDVIKQLAKKYYLPIFQPKHLHTPEILQLIANLCADIMVVVAYGNKLPKEVLKLPRLGCINVHGSLLPRWRGAAPIQRAIEAGDKKTGITIIQMDAKLDTGNIIAKNIYNILPNDTSETLSIKLAKLGSTTLLTTLDKIVSGTCTFLSQNENLATYANKLRKEEARINWKLSAMQLERSIRAFNPWPVSFFQVKGQFIKVWKAYISEEKSNIHIPGTIISTTKNGIYIAAKNGILTFTQLQPEGKRSMTVQDLLNSRQSWFTPGSILD